VPDVSAVFVNHLSSTECARAVESFRLAAREEGLRGETVVVDCASGPEEADRLRRIAPDRLVLLAENRGYSGGLNAGIAQAGAGRLLLCNADVEFLPGSIAPLISAAAQDSVGAAAPVQFANSSCRIHLPSGFGSGFIRDLRQMGVFPARGEARRFARWARMQWTLWHSGGEAGNLVGSIVATRRAILDRVGRFDERFEFEYEETEWQDRLRRGGLRLRVVADSRAVHRLGASSARNPESAARSARSRARYRRRRYGRFRGRLLDFAERRAKEKIAPGIAVESAPLVLARGPDFAVAASPNASVLPFVAARLDRDVDLREIAAILGPRFAYRVFRVADGSPEGVFWARP